MRQTFTDYRFMHQKCDTGFIDVEGDTARSRLSVFEVNLPPDTDGAAMIFGVYEDEYRRLEEGWRFAFRRFTFTTSIRLPVTSIQHLQTFTPAFEFAV
jgi:hypothetical protein